MDAPTDRDTEILRCVLDADVRAAGTLLVRGYADEVYALCSSMVRDRTIAEDLSQEVFTRAFTALPKFRGDASVRTWILRIARNRCIDHLRAQNRAPAHIEEEPDAQPTSEPSIADLIVHREDVMNGLNALSETERALVVLRFGHELAYPELADAFGIGQGAVRMRISRAVSKMRDALAPMDSMRGGTAPAPARRAAALFPLGRRRARSAPGAMLPQASHPEAPASGGGSPFACAASARLRANLERMAGALA